MLVQTDTFQKSWDSNPASENILRILRMKICPYQASTDSPRALAQELDLQMEPELVRNETKSSKVHTWGPG